MQLSNKELLTLAYLHVFPDTDRNEIKFGPMKEFSYGQFVSVSAGDETINMEASPKWGGLFGKAGQFVTAGNVRGYLGGASEIVMDACGSMISGSEIASIRD